VVGNNGCIFFSRGALTVGQFWGSPYKYTMNDISITLTPRPLSLRKNISWMISGDIFYAVCCWGILVALAKLGSAEMVGQFVLGLAIVDPVVTFANLQLRTVLATDAKGEYHFGHYLGLRIVTSAVALLLVVAITIVIGYRMETALVIALLGLVKAIDSISDLLYGLLQKHESMDRIAKSMFMKGPLAFAVMGCIIYFTSNLLWGTLGLALAGVLILVKYDVRNAAQVLRTVDQGAGATDFSKSSFATRPKPLWQIRKLSQITWFALPLGLVVMLISLNNNITRYFVERYLGERELGIFGALAYIMLAGFTVVGALGQVSGPRMAKYYSIRDLIAFRKLLLRLVGIGAVLGGVGILVAASAGRWVLTLLYQPEYAEHLDVFLWLMVASGISYVASFLGYGVTATRQFSRLVVPYILVSATALYLSTILIPTYGLVGAAWTMGAASLTSCVMLLIILANTMVFK
jgi:O-antigen/teichoic acid export membrane protein